ncbi:MAG: hypothetical protein KAS12_02050 [Candidatus Aenigmarchaeota archaeon]|nr:hypothetical protein [Candidatus Aenigmarchaeota archaeon]
MFKRLFSRRKDEDKDLEVGESNEEKKQLGKEDPLGPEKVRQQQLKQLLDIGIPDAMGISEKEFSNLVPLPERKEGTLLVVSSKALSLAKQLKLANIDNHLDLSLIKDIIISKQLVYWQYGVKDGTAMLDKSPKVCREIFKQQHRRGLTIAEIIALSIQYPDIVKKEYSVDVLGSTYKPGFTSYFTFDYLTKLLDCDLDRISSPKHGSASCEMESE